MIARDHHNSAPNADPQSRHHLWNHLEKMLAFQYDKASRRMMHNHPSGVAEPSQADEDLTRVLRQALALIDVRVLDHFVVGRGGAMSFAERGLL